VTIRKQGKEEEEVKQRDKRWEKWKERRRRVHCGGEVCSACSEATICGHNKQFKVFTVPLG